MKIGTTELLVVLAIVIIIFGPSQIPKLSRMLGKSIKNFRKSVSDDDEVQAEKAEKTVTAADDNQ